MEQREVVLNSGNSVRVGCKQEDVEWIIEGEDRDMKRKGGRDTNWKVPT